MKSYEAAYRALGERLLLMDKYQELIVHDSLIKLLKHMYTEEEVDIVLALKDGMLSAKAVAKKVNRPVEQVRPILESLAKRILILGIAAKGIGTYGLLNLYPIIYDAQMLRADKLMREEGDDNSWHREFVRLFKDFLDEFYDWLAPQPVAEKYQIMGLPFGRVISVEQAIDATPGLGIVAYPSDFYSEMVDRSKKSLALVSTCTCRYGMDLLGKGCGRLRNTCSTMGLPAEGAIKSGLGRRVTKEEFLEAKLAATEAGLVHMSENVLDPMLVCSCCSCCCEILGILKKFNSPALYTQSHFEAVIDTEACTGCKACQKICPMDAITMEKQTRVGKKKSTGKKKVVQKAVIDYSRCIGCGVCVTHCDKYKAITMRKREVFKQPAENMAESFARRYFELKGTQDNTLPRLTLGVTRLLSNMNPIHITGPRAISFKNNK